MDNLNNSEGVIDLGTSAFEAFLGSDIEIYRTIVDRMEQGVLVYDDQRVLCANSQLCKILDCPPELVAPGASLEDYIAFGAARGDYSGNAGLTLQAMRMHIAAGKDYVVERSLPDGRTIRIDCRNSGRFGIGTYTDITKARKQSAILETTIETMAQGLLVCDRKTIIAANSRLAELLDIPAGLLEPGRSWLDIFKSCRNEEHRANNELFLVEANDAIESGNSFTFELYAGSRILLTECRHQHAMMFVTCTDVTEARARELLLQESEAEVRKLAEIDGLTGLANRRSFDRELFASFTAYSDNSPSGKLALILIDLDRFKSVNDTYGHNTGDALLQELSRRFTALVGNDDKISRIGGDEFAAIVHASSNSAIQEIAQRLCDAANQTVVVGQSCLNVGASIGVAFCSDEMASSDQLLTAADLALYDAKECGRGTVRVYQPLLGERAMKRYAIEKDLENALRKSELSLYYQVQRDLRTNTDVGYEALMRWMHPEKGMIGPADFIPIAEETGAIVEIGRWALIRAASDIAARDTRSRVAVNVSPVQFVKSDLVSDVRQALALSGLPPERLEIEVTEDLLIENTENTLRVFNELRQLGVGITLDDFGAGYSSLAYLTRFPFTKLKIDRSFIDRMVREEASRALVNSILVLASSLNLKVTAEGVETRQQLDILRQSNCGEAQGYLLGKPMALLV